MPTLYWCYIGVHTKFFKPRACPLGDYCTNLRIGMQTGKRTKILDQRNKQTILKIWKTNSVQVCAPSAKS